MTRDTHRVHDDREIVSDADIYAALWATAPFPRLPEDAPSELKKLTAEVDDPRRIYGIHRARRRHNFQLLVERYILQIRYGCQSKTCTTTTCFSCRKRVANGAPVRRYNSASARTLAIYMASQDNPELGLCHHNSAGRMTADTPKPYKPKPGLAGQLRTSVVQSSGIKSDGKEGLKTAPKNGAFVEDLPDLDNNAEKKRPAEVLDRWAKLDLSLLEDPDTKDPRSFVQNVFGTVAFKMIEWLTPRNLAIFSQSQRQEDAQSRPSDDHKQEDANRPAQSNETKLTEPTIPDYDPEDTHEAPKTTNANQGPELLSSPSSTPVSQPTASQDAPNTAIPSDSKPHVNSVAMTAPSSNRRKKSDSIESQNPKGILSKQQKQTDSTIDPMSSPPTSIPPLPKHKIPRQTLITSPKMKMSEFSTQVHEIKHISTAPIVESFEAPVVKDDDNDRPCRPQEIKEAPVTWRTNITAPSDAKPSPTKDVVLPQSMSSFSIESINFLCDVMQDDNLSEKHLLRPESIEGSSKRIRDAPPFPLSREVKLRKVSSQYRTQWKTFIEQSLFDVLGKSDSLIKSFCDEGSEPFDSQTIWYLMLRVTRVAPSLVFDCLWNVTGTLFRPPKQLEDAYEWAKDHKAYSRKPMSNHDAARVLNICLHALIASAPFVSDTRQMANMSRIRSYGLAMLSREYSSVESVDLCLAYEDAFSYEPAFRLARRLFAAIPTRRRFTELLDLQRGNRNGEVREPDVLELLVDSLKFLDLDTTPILYFTDDERSLHEKRVPTLILDWARAVMLQEWEGSAEVPNDGPFGGALAMMAAIYKKRKSLILGDIHFRTEYFAERLDPVAMPLEWLSYNQNKKTTHLLDHPYLFDPSTLVTYFRAINYSRMNQSYERAHTTGHLVSHFMSEGSLVTEKYKSDKLHERLRIATSEFMVLEIRRTNVLLDTFNAIWRREERELMRPLKVRLGEEGGEEGLDSGGVQQEFFRLAIAEALNPDYGTFTIDARTKMTWFMPGSPEPLWKFELIGMIVSLAVYNGLTLPVTFPKALYRKLLDEEVTELHHIADGWTDLANGLTTLLEWDEKDGLVEDVFARTYEFSVEQFGQPVSREMGASATHWPQFSELQSNSNPLDAPSVTNENRNNYVSDYIRWLTDVSIQPQFEAFKKGFFSCIDRRSITLFDPDTLQSVVEGIQEIDISEMRRATRYIGWDASHRSIRDFWSIVKRYDLSQKRKLLEFVTASDRVPVGGMRNLQFTLQRNGIDDGHLPSSYTCYGILLLPEYSSREVLRDKLAMALENSKGFGFA
ncbi:HECT-domain-containing protein-like protein [Cadophora sp. MPI-SDFR-AT-0126]|nr:HECT-domain-containing protein-like protein [Leotiomycetes sp. MPI-SDFR-AT-0126]